MISNVIYESSSNFTEFGFKPLNPGAQRAVQEFGTCEDLQSTQNGRVNLVGDFESHSWLVFLQ